MRWIPTKKKVVLIALILLVLVSVFLLVFRCDHVWLEATCSAPKTCEKCGRTKGDTVEHSYTEANCNYPAMCRYCYEIQGEPLGHDWQPATCISLESCSRCIATRGHRSLHTLGESTDGITKTCTVCQKQFPIKYVALTFDDGPSGDNTQNLLDGLKERNAKATFFLCGYQISYHPGFPEKIAEQGHEIGLHTENHTYLSNVSSDEVRREISKELDRMPNIPIRLLRPPGGHYNGTVESICSSYGLSIIMWSLDTLDWDHDDASEIVPNVLRAKDGDIILMHDLKSSSVEAALEAIDILQAEGYEFVTVSELAQITGTDLYGGSVYYSMN